ncbi:MAG: tetratricopeptide repeat-containing sensor histidine kinase [Chloroherpetonaceae bacterium]|nr:tetratricopeptide repeat-containing sensor histidine kinase [Chloroherpetonaceae bacterium]
MMKTRLLLVLILFLFGVEKGLSQPQKIDSLKKLVASISLSGNVDTGYVLLLNQLAWELRGDEMLLAINYAVQAESLSVTLGYERGLIQSNNYLGVIYRNLGNYAKSLSSYFTALAHAEQTGNRIEYAYATNNIGDLYKLQGDYKRAKEFGMRAYAIFDSLKNGRGVAYALIRLGEVSIIEKNFVEAEQYLTQCLSIREALGDTIGISNALSRIGEMHLKSGNFAKAIEFNARSTEILQIAKLDLAQVVTNHLNIAQAYFLSGDYAKAIERARLSYDISGRIKFRKHQQHSAELLAKCYAALNDFRSAYHYHIRYSEIADSISGAITKRDMQVLQLAYESEKRRASIEYLTKQTETEKNIRYILSAIIFLIVIFVSIIIFNYREKRKQNLRLQTLNTLLEEEKEKALSAKQDAENANLIKTKFLGIASHDLKNPLTNVLGFSHLIEEEERISTTVKVYAAQIRVSANKMLRLISDLLDTVALESGSIELNKSTVSLKNAVLDAIQRNQPAAQAKQIVLEYNDSDDDLFASLDLERFDMVLDNLISNAIKYSPLTKTVWISLKKNDESNTLRLMIKDEGLGMTQEDLSKLFGRFTRLSARPTAGESSTGLGLSIVKELVQLHNGKVWAESDGQGKGTTFFLELPLSLQTAPLV